MPGLTITPVKVELLEVDTKDIGESRRSRRNPRGVAKCPPTLTISPRAASKSPASLTISPMPPNKIPGGGSVSPRRANKSPSSPKFSGSRQQTRATSPKAAKPSLTISPVSGNNSSLLSPTTSILLSPKATFSSEKPSDTVNLVKRQDKVEQVDSPVTSPTKLSLTSKAVSLQPREPEVSASFPFTAMGEPKFGANKDLVTFADLALKSKTQATKGFPGKMGQLSRKANKIERKKVSARISLEQSNIEDTKTLIALRAARDEEDEAANIEEGSPQTYSKDEANPTQEIEEVEDQPDARVTAVLEAAAKSRDEDSRATRSSLQVETLGLNSSTLDMELHALRNLVFNEILGEGVDEFKTDSVRTEEEVEQEELAELALAQMESDAIEAEEEEEEGENSDPDDLPRETRTNNKLLPRYLPELP